MKTKEQIEKEIKEYTENRLNPATAKAETGDMSEDNILTMCYWQAVVDTLTDVIKDD